jgi:hypothetical protein
MHLDNILANGYVLEFEDRLDGGALDQSWHPFTSRSGAPPRKLPPGTSSPADP